MVGSNCDWKPSKPLFTKIYLWQGTYIFYMFITKDIKYDFLLCKYRKESTLTLSYQATVKWHLLGHHVEKNDEVEPRPKRALSITSVPRDSSMTMPIMPGWVSRSSKDCKSFPKWVSKNILNIWRQRWYSIFHSWSWTLKAMHNWGEMWKPHPLKPWVWPIVRQHAT